MKLLILLTTFLFFGFTPFAPIPPAPDTIATKGGLLTNNGTADVVAPACADDQIIVWDSTVTGDPYGFKCEAKPVAATGPTFDFSPDTSGSSAPQVGDYTTAGNTRITFTITTNGNPVILQMVPTTTTFGPYYTCANSGSSANIRLIRDDSVVLSEWEVFNLATEHNGLTIIAYDNPPAGTHTYKLQAQRTSNICSLGITGRLMATIY